MTHHSPKTKQLGLDGWIRIIVGYHQLYHRCLTMVVSVLISIFRSQQLVLQALDVFAETGNVCPQNDLILDGQPLQDCLDIIGYVSWILRHDFVINLITREY